MPPLTTDTFRAEKQIRSILGLVALVVIPPFLALWAAARCPEMTDPTALDHVQLARNLAAGQGFVTSVLRPLSLALHPTPAPHPDLVNAPVHPLLLAGAFSLTGPSEKAATALGVGLWLLTVWLVFWIARYWWDWRAAGLATVFCVAGVVGLTTAAAGLPQPVLALLVLGAVATVFPKPSRAREGNFGLALWQPIATGALCGAAALTDYRLLPLALVLGIYLAKTAERRSLAVTLFVGGLGLVWLPWFVRNLLVSGRIFGLYWYAALENTRQFPGESIWRWTDVPAHPLLYLLMHPGDLVRKLAYGLAHYRSVGLGVLEPVAMLLGVVALFGAPHHSSRRRLAWIAISSAILTMVWSCLTRPDARLLLAWTPVLGCVAAAQLAAWVQANVGGYRTNGARIRLSAAGMRTLTYAGVVTLLVFPVAMQLGRAHPDGRKEMVTTAALIHRHVPATAVILTDVPAIVAWHWNRPALLLCQRESDLAELEEQAGKLDGVYLSPALAALSPRETGDWWIWVASPRGVYRGLAVAARSSLPGILRLPPEPTTGAAAEPKWLDDLQKAVQENPRTAEAHTQLAFGYFTRRWLRDAQREFQEAIRLDEYDVEALIGLWQTMAQLRHADGTLRLSQLAGQVTSQDPRARSVLEQAAAHFDQMSSQQPGDPWLLLNLIVCRSRLGQWKEVEANYARLARALPKTFPPRLMLADLYLQQGELAKAAAECESLVQEHPDMPTAHHLAGRVWLAQGQWEHALKELAITIRLRPQWVAAQVLAAQACQHLKRYDEAAQYLQTALQLSPHLLRLKLGLAEVRVAQGQTAEAIGLYSQILNSAPDQPVALNNLAELLARTGRAAEALPLVRRAVRLYPQNPTIRDTAGFTCWAAGEHDEAYLHLREAIRLDPQLGLAHYHLGQAQLTDGQTEPARRSFQTALKCGLPDRDAAAATRALATTTGTPKIDSGSPVEK